MTHSDKMTILNELEQLLDALQGQAFPTGASPETAELKHALVAYDSYIVGCVTSVLGGKHCSCMDSNASESVDALLDSAGDGVFIQQLKSRKAQLDLLAQLSDQLLKLNE